MAIMCPSPLPGFATADPRRAAERTMYEALERGLSDEHRAFYGIAWLARRRDGSGRDGEADFVVAHPKRGMVVIEVKGGAVARDGASGRWTSRDRAGAVHDIGDPVAQARDSRFALLDKLRTVPGWGGRGVRAWHAVALPDCKAAPEALGPDLPREIVIYADDLNWLPEKVDSLFSFWEGREGHGDPIDEQAMTLVQRVLAPSFELRQPLGVEVREAEREILRLTEQQLLLLRALARNRRVQVSGGAGTGKTILALEKARRLAEEGYRTLLTCFNRPLAQFLRASAGEVPNLTVLNFHQLCYEMAAKAELPLPDREGPTPPREYFEELLPRALEHALDRFPDQRFDAIVVDEGQDFHANWWLPLQLALTDPDDGILYVFYDDNQRIYGGASALPEKLVPVHLGENLRNTRAIHTLARRFYTGGELDASGPEGQAVESVEAADAAAIRRETKRVLHHLIRDGAIPPRDIAVLTGKALNRSALGADATIGAFRVTQDQDADPEAVLLETIHRFKGLERPVVVLTEIDEYLQRGQEELVYVGITRARAHLVVVGGREALARLASS